VSDVGVGVWSFISSVAQARVIRLALLQAPAALQVIPLVGPHRLQS